MEYLEIVKLYKMRDELLAVAFEIVNHWNLNHGVATGLLAHRGASHVDKYLTGEGGVVDAHVELKALVLCLTANTLANQIYTVTHITHIVNRGYLEHVSLVVGEIWVGLDGLCHLLKAIAVLQLYIHHAAMNTLAERNGH